MAGKSSKWSTEMQSAESLTKLSDSPRGRPLDLSIRAILEHTPGSARQIRYLKTGEIEMKLTKIKVARTIPASAEEAFNVWLDPKRRKVSSRS
jgi:hypothetical protein